MRILRNQVIFVVILLLVQISECAKTPDPYKVLGISRTATQDDIKKAFNKRSRQYHPDRNKQDPRAKQKFEKVVNAYQLLKDPQRRKMYDMTGSDDPNAAGMGGGFGNFGFGQGGGGGFGINLQDILNMGFGGGFGGFGGGHPGGRRAGGGRQAGGRQAGGGGHRTYTFTFGGGGGPGGFRFQM